MIEKFSVVLIIGILVSSAFVILDSGASGDETRLLVDNSAYRLAPFGDITTTMEDEEYNSTYYSMMGGLTVNSFTTDADWLTWEYSQALTMNMTDNKGFWSLDLTNATDSSGNNNHGTLYGPTTVEGISSIGQALSFDGDDYVSIPHDDSLNISDEITLEAWIYPTFDDSGEHMILSKGGNWSYDEPQCYELTMDRDRPLFQMKVAGSNNWYGAAPTDPITKNTWHHIAGVYDGGRFYIYIDGVNQTSIYTGWDGNYQGEVYSGGLPTDDNNISIGRRVPATWGSLFYEGYIDEVRIWDRAIPGWEMQEHAAIPGTRCLDLTGTPDNGDVGDHNVVINVTDGEGRYDEHSFTLTVENTPPQILNDDLLEIHQDEEYSVQYTSDEEAGDLTWSLDTEASWLSMDEVTGVLSGTPTNDDVGAHEVTVVFNDGNGGTDTSMFDLEVIDVNDPPWITTDNVLTATEDQYFYVDYDGDDIDGEYLTWSMVTDMDWLSLDPYWGILNGTPTNDDVGVNEVNITASDPRGLSESTVFQLEVLNVNDGPVWVDTPANTSIEEGATYRFDINANDIDPGDVLIYDVFTYPAANISLNGSTGMLEWTATRSIFLEQDYTLDLMVKVTDGEETISYPFHLDLILNPSPTTTLIAPINKTTVVNITTLRWEGEDDGDETLTYDVYLSQMRSNVLSLKESSKIAEAINETEFILVDLEEGNTYYWTAIPHDIYSTGTCIDETFSFFVNVPPVTELEYPQDGEIVPYNDLALECVGNDPDMDSMQYHFYISTIMEDVETRAESAHHIAGPIFRMEEVQPGAVYYWTVIAKDDHSYGICIDGIYSFTVNIPPTIDAVEGQQGNVGSEIEVDINGTDADAPIMDTFEFSILEGPDGMTIVPATGMISWTPVVADIGVHTIKIQLSDGLDSVNLSFQIEVMEALAEDDDGDDRSSSGVIIIAGIAILAIIIAAVVIYLIMKKRDEDEKAKEPRQETVHVIKIPDLGSGPIQGGTPTIERTTPPDPLVSGRLETIQTVSSEPVAPPQEPTPVPQTEPPAPPKAPPEPTAPPVPEQPEAPLSETPTPPEQPEAVGPPQETTPATQPEPPAPPEPVQAPPQEPAPVPPSPPEPVQTETQPPPIKPEADEAASTKEPPV